MNVKHGYQQKEMIVAFERKDNGKIINQSINQLIFIVA